MNWNPIRRSPIKPKPKPHRESWRSGKIRLNGREMAQLRQDCFVRSRGFCENSIDGKRCLTRVNWVTGHLAHIQSRGRGGSDSKENCLFVCVPCHKADTLNRQKLQPHSDWIAAA